MRRTRWDAIHHRLCQIGSQQLPLWFGVVVGVGGGVAGVGCGDDLFEEFGVALALLPGLGGVLLELPFEEAGADGLDLLGAVVEVKGLSIRWWRSNLNMPFFTRLLSNATSTALLRNAPPNLDVRSLLQTLGSSPLLRRRSPMVCVLRCLP